ncbi:hypothetical protein IscW_ISCW023389, partial [Ixodes scapularis]
CLLLFRKRYTRSPPPTTSPACIAFPPMPSLSISPRSLIARLFACLLKQRDEPQNSFRSSRFTCVLRIHYVFLFFFFLPLFFLMR